MFFSEKDWQAKAPAPQVGQTLSSVNRRLYMRSCLLSFLAAAASLCGQTRPQGADWPMFNRDLAGTRYSPLAQITTRNVAN